MRLLAQTIHDRLRELFSSDLLFADAFIEDVVGVNAVFNRAQPGVVNSLGGGGLADVNQHHDRAHQQPGGICQILAGAARR